jgi:hypothetical protein
MPDQPHLKQHGDRPQPRCCPQHRHDLLSQ